MWPIYFLYNEKLAKNSKIDWLRNLNLNLIQKLTKLVALACLSQFLFFDLCLWSSLWPLSLWPYQHWSSLNCKSSMTFSINLYRFYASFGSSFLIILTWNLAATTNIVQVLKFQFYFYIFIFMIKMNQKTILSVYIWMHIR